MALTTLREVAKEVQTEEWHFNTERAVEFCPLIDSPPAAGGAILAFDPISGLPQLVPAPGAPTAGPIFLHDDILRIDVTDDDIQRTYDVVRRGNQLYDKVNHTYDFTGCIKCDVVWFAYWEISPEMGQQITIPAVFRRYITYRASTRAVAQMTNNTALTQLSQQQEVMARAACYEYEANQGDSTFFGSTYNSNYKSYRPYQTMLRR